MSEAGKDGKAIDKKSVSAEFVAELQSATAEDVKQAKSNIKLNDAEFSRRLLAAIAGENTAQDIKALGLVPMSKKNSALLMFEDIRYYSRNYVVYETLTAEQKARIAATQLEQDGYVHDTPHNILEDIMADAVGEGFTLEQIKSLAKISDGDWEKLGPVLAQFRASQK